MLCHFKTSRQVRCSPLLITDFVTFDFKSDIDPGSIARLVLYTLVRETDNNDNDWQFVPIGAHSSVRASGLMKKNKQKNRFFSPRRYTNGLVQVRHYPRKIEESDRFTSAIESSLRKSPEDAEEEHVGQSPCRGKAKWRGKAEGGVKLFIWWRHKRPLYVYLPFKTLA